MLASHHVQGTANSRDGIFQLLLTEFLGQIVEIVCTVSPVVLRASGDVTVRLLALSKLAWFEPEVLWSAFLLSVMQCGHGKFICEIRTEESTHPSASWEMHMNSVLLKSLRAAEVSIQSVAKCWGDNRKQAKQASPSRPLLVQTGKESQIGYIALLRPFLCEMRERRLKYFGLILYYMLHILYCYYILFS